MNPLTNLLKTSEVRGHQITINISDLCRVLDGMTDEIDDQENLTIFLLNLLMILLTKNNK